MKILTTLVAIYILIIISGLLVQCTNGPPPQWITTDLVAIQCNDKTYTIIPNGYRADRWRYNYIKVNINKSIPEENPKVRFYLNGGTPSSYMEVTLLFNNREEAKEALGNGFMNVGVKAGRDANVAIANSKATCFISMLME